MDRNARIGVRRPSRLRPAGDRPHPRVRADAGRGVEHRLLHFGNRRGPQQRRREGPHDGTRSVAVAARPVSTAPQADPPIAREPGPLGADDPAQTPAIKAGQATNSGERRNLVTARL